MLGYVLYGKLNDGWYLIMNIVFRKNNYKGHWCWCIL